ncbi:MAG: CRISPR-associated protein Cas4 [Candidatus Thermoplasmatota archaeon]|nr:CRISPR-associated protein Cas4 [Candidatus Thermoplasmatota archaeon]
MLIFGLLLVVCAGVLCAYAVRIRSSVSREKQRSGIPEGTVVYTDLNVPATPLFSKRFRLSGKPDYILQRDGQFLPVEVKTGGQSQPQQGHILQLAAYCLLIEEAFGVFVPEGILVYNTKPYTIHFNPKLRFELESVIKTMRHLLRSGVVERNHNQPGRCQRCSMRQYCTSKII